MVEVRVRILGDQGHDAYAKMIQYISQAFDGIKEIKVAGAIFLKMRIMVNIVDTWKLIRNRVFIA